MNEYNYEGATSRNIGILTKEEQKTLSELKVAVPGVGGLGGTQVMIMARLGIKNFSLADFDTYDLSNFNRQYGATVTTIGKSKVETMLNHVKSVHPNAIVQTFHEGLTINNVVEFVSSADVILDAIDLTAMSMREALYKEARRQGKYVVTCGPIGYGFFCLIFDPNGRSYEEVFNTSKGGTESEKMQIFLKKITPKNMHAKYMSKGLVSPSFDEPDSVRFSWISPAIFMAAGNGISELLKIVLKKGNIISVPHCYQYDAYTNKLAISAIQS